MNTAIYFYRVTNLAAAEFQSSAVTVLAEPECNLFLQLKTSKFSLVSRVLGELNL